MILTLPSYERAYHKLTGDQKGRVAASIAVLEQGFGDPHAHRGIGIRRFGKFFEARAGRGLRILFVSRGTNIILATVGDHDEIRAFVKNNPKPKA
jgi:hypothetical protein